MTYHLTGDALNDSRKNSTLRVSVDASGYAAWKSKESGIPVKDLVK